MNKSIQVIEAEINELINSRNKLFELKKPIEIQISNLSDSINQKKELIINEKINSDLALKDLYELVMFEDGSSSMTLHRAAQKLIVKDLGLWLSGYSPISEQKQVRLKFIKESSNSLKQHFESLSLIIPFIKPNDEHGNKNISIFENSLSDNGSFNLQITPDNLFNITVNRKRILQSFNNLLDALTYIQEHHYYAIND